jgi:hypothetical protein
MSRLLLPGTADRAIREIVAGYAAGKAMRVVNFHATPRYRADEFRRQMERYAAQFSPITPANFDRAFDGHPVGDRPGLIPVMFEGYRDNLDVMLPILEEFGFAGWLIFPPYFLDVPDEGQRDYAASHVLHLAARDEYQGERIALSWDEARDIAARGHGFACHSGNHVELRPDSDATFLQREIAAAKARMERELGQSVDIFCWLRGAETGINPLADRMLVDAGFRYLFSNFKIQRLR